jgi:transposase
MEELQRQLEAMRAELQQLRAENAALKAENAELKSQLAELQLELVRRKKGFRPKPNTSTRQKSTKDRRAADERQHPGTTRPEPPIDENTVLNHDVTADVCPACHGTLIDTGEVIEQIVEDIPQPQVEVHRYRRHVYECACCQKRVTAASTEVGPQARIGPNAVAFQAYCRGYLGISLGKANDLLSEFMGLSQSRAAALGQLVRMGELLDPVVQQLMDLLRSEPVVHADETGWRINGKNVWCWIFCNQKLALYLIDHRRAAAVVQRVLGDTFEGVLVTDFYAAYGKLDSRKQKCLVHLLRELHTLRQELPKADVETFIQPVMTLFQDAIALGKQRDTLAVSAYQQQCDQLHERLDTLVFSQPTHADCRRICNRLAKHRFELLLFLEQSDVPPDNNLGERDIRAVAAARADGGVNRTDAGAKVFANIKSVIKTCQKQGLNFFQYAKSAIQATLTGQPPPLPLAAETQ